MQTLIAASILAADFTRLGEQITESGKGGADWIHVDVMDGHFVPNITIGPLIVEAARRATTLPLDVHLMIENPDRCLADFIGAGANLLTVHQETCPHLHRTVQRIRELGARPGVALNPSTPVETLVDILPLVDLVLVMTVNPGFGGQRFIRETLPWTLMLPFLMALRSTARGLLIRGGRTSWVTLASLVALALLFALNARSPSAALENGATIGYLCWIGAMAAEMVVLLIGVARVGVATCVNEG